MLDFTVEQNQRILSKIGIVVFVIECRAVELDDFVFLSKNTGKLIHDAAHDAYECVFRSLRDQRDFFF